VVLLNVQSQKAPNVTQAANDENSGLLGHFAAVVEGKE